MAHKEARHKLELRQELAPLRVKWRAELGLPPLEDIEKDTSDIYADQSGDQPQFRARQGNVGPWQ